MPKLKHDKNPQQSEVINHIAGAMQCDTERASRVFNELRKRGIIVFDRIDRAWHGADNRISNKSLRGCASTQAPVPGGVAAKVWGCVRGTN